MGQQIVPADWVRASVNPSEPHLLPGKRDSSDWVLGYGYQWWIPENPEGDFLAIGIYNQFIYVNPKYDVVIAKTSAYADYDLDGEAKELETIAFFRAIAAVIAVEFFLLSLAHNQGLTRRRGPFFYPARCYVWFASGIVVP